MVTDFSRYFQALAKGEVPPVKTRLEQPLESANERLGGITKGILAALNKQVCNAVFITEHSYMYS